MRHVWRHPHSRTVTPPSLSYGENATPLALVWGKCHTTRSRTGELPQHSLSYGRIATPLALVWENCHTARSRTGALPHRSLSYSDATLTPVRGNCHTTRSRTSSSALMGYLYSPTPSPGRRPFCSCVGSACSRGEAMVMSSCRGHACPLMGLHGATSRAAGPVYLCKACYGWQGPCMGWGGHMM